jgi:hypothetical protein
MLPRPHSQRTYTPQTHWQQQQLLGAREYYPRARLEPKGQSSQIIAQTRSVLLECERVGEQAPKQQRSPATFELEQRQPKPASRLDQPLD